MNSIAELRRLPTQFGAEIDIRYHENELVLAHDPFGHHVQEATRLADWLGAWAHEGPLVMNVKSEGIEAECIKLLTEHQVRDWFFLDLSPPYLVKYGLLAERHLIDGLSPENLAVRFSEHEPVESALALAGKAAWVWVDCFTRMPLDPSSALALRNAGYRTCIVSPELQKHDVGRIPEFRALLSGVGFDAVCTKRPDLWRDDVAVA